jgi:tRNA threonylcarbamoyladenosine biosynthesis protein TsaE
MKLLNETMRTSLRSSSEEETRRLGERIGRLLKGGEVLALQGTLGAGKTCFVQGLARGLGVQETEVVSPTYTLIHELSGPLRLFHIDLYRLIDPDDLENIGFFEAFGPDAVTVVEWADRFPASIPEPYLLIRIERLSETVREFTFEPRGGHSKELVGKIEDGFPNST